ncbi:hypothetical protein ACFVWF_29545 [Rhodococcus qingshengii]|uniref:hypothetical protein n=1 Tax=Rhodococcus qingshengii TaxID=334542 RepID=UPI0036DE0D2E
MRRQIGCRAIPPIAPGAQLSLEKAVNLHHERFERLVDVPQELAIVLIFTDSLEIDSGVDTIDSTYELGPIPLNSSAFGVD